MTPGERWHKRGADLLEEIDRTAVPPGFVALWFLGQASLVIKGAGPVVYIDPFFSLYPDEHGISKREYPPPFDPGMVKHADWVFCTHDHIDHLDPATLGPMAASSPRARFVVPAPLSGTLERFGIGRSRIVPARAGVRMELDGLDMTPVAAAHEEYQLDENGDHRCLGYAITMNNATVFHAGDAVETPELVDTLRSLRIDIACLPINGADWKRRRSGIVGNMNARDAANIGAASGADLVVPLHWDLFARNGENPAVFVDYMTRLHPDRKFKVMVPGERLLYVK
jgi:L-ascorbate metabolism protein UlaG (beta-lactamase superfamily)